MTPFNIAASCGGEYFGPEDVGGREVTAVTTDSRKTPSGSLFVPIKGERADGHDYIEQALTLLFGQFLGIIKSGYLESERQDHGRRKHRACQRSSSRLVDAADRLETILAAQRFILPEIHLHSPVRAAVPALCVRVYRP